MQHCRTLTVGEYTDWYLPSCNELELCYRHLRPTADNNAVFSASPDWRYDTCLANGTNLTSIPAGSAYSITKPSRSVVTSFHVERPEAFDEKWYWSSTEHLYYNHSAQYQHFGNGYQFSNFKTFTDGSVRAVRRVLIAQGD